MIRSSLPRLEVCLTPALLSHMELVGRVVVIIDVLRATTTIPTALFHGARKVIPVDSVEKCIALGEELGAITAGERDGHLAPGLKHGNSPLEYPREFIEGKTLVLTTTNGTRLLHMANHADRIVTGSFGNLSAVCDYLLLQEKPVVLACAGWKDRVNLEDTLLAGAIIQRVKEHYQVACDAALMAELLFLQVRGDLFGSMKQASHVQRLSNYGLEADIRHCLLSDTAPVLPVLEDGALILEKPGQAG